jgi:hypothetical protein
MHYMARFGIVSGLLLCVDTAMALFGSVSKSPLLFIPMMLGIPILFFGVVALNPHRRRQALATAAGIGAIGCVIGFGELVHLVSKWVNTETVNLHSTRIVALMVAICMVFLVGYFWTLVHRGRLKVVSSRRRV